MKTVVLASCTPEDEAMLAERRRLDQDRRDDRSPLLDLAVAEVTEAIDWS